MFISSIEACNDVKSLSCRRITIIIHFMYRFGWTWFFYDHHRLSILYIMKFGRSIWNNTRKTTLSVGLYNKLIIGFRSETYTSIIFKFKTYTIYILFTIRFFTVGRCPGCRYYKYLHDTRIVVGKFIYFYTSSTNKKYNFVKSKSSFDILYITKHNM